MSQPPFPILILKTGALGDVLRTTSILPGLHSAHPGARITWVTATGARDLVAHHPLVAETVTLDPGNVGSVTAAASGLGRVRWKRLLSFDDERPLCLLASRLDTDQLTGAHLGPDDEPTYTDDANRWFQMGLISKLGKEEADRRKMANELSHPRIFAEMLGIPAGRPELPLPADVRTTAAAFFAAQGLDGRVPVVGLNTGAGGRWRTKEMPLDEVVRLVGQAHAARHGNVRFLLLGGPDERERNRTLLARLIAECPEVRVVDGGTDNGLLAFAALVAACDVVVTSDSLALHMAVAARRWVLAFFAPTSAAEIELYGRGEKVLSTSPDYCSYRPDADNSSITAERLMDPLMSILDRAAVEASR